jgi:ERCC4-type nuclease
MELKTKLKKDKKYQKETEKRKVMRSCICEYMLCDEISGEYNINEFKGRYISVDFREDKSGIAGMLSEKYGFKVSRVNLKSGDFVIGGEIAVERKTAADFVQSIMDGRLFSQASAMRKTYATNMIIIEGNVFDTGFNIHVNAVKGAIVSLAAIWKIPVLFTKDAEDTAFHIELIAGQRDEAAQGLYSRYGRRPKQFRRRQSYILQGFPGIGPKLANEILDKFGCIKNAVNLDQNSLMAVRGLGKTKACNFIKMASNLEGKI